MEGNAIARGSAEVDTDYLIVQLNAACAPLAGGGGVTIRSPKLDRRTAKLYEIVNTPRTFRTRGARETHT